jgi:hypothetical protein
MLAHHLLSFSLLATCTYTFILITKVLYKTLHPNNAMFYVFNYEVRRRLIYEP